MAPKASTEAPGPLAPSVEKAYYRKCIALKRRLNEVEAANDEAKIRRARLDRAIMKMRLERAFLLDELRKRMDYNIDGSEASGDEGIQTPPQDRPYRDKRRRQQSGTGTVQGGGSNAGAFQTVQYQPGPGSTRPNSGQGNAPMIQGPGGRMVQANAVDDANRPVCVDEYGNPPPLGHGSPYGPPPTGLPSSTAVTNGAGGDKEKGLKDRADEAGEAEGAQSTAFNPVNS